MGMVIQQRPPHMMPQQPQQPNIMAMEQGPRVSQASPLLAQHLVGRHQLPPQQQQQQQQHPQQQQQQQHPQHQQESLQQHDQMSDSGNGNPEDLDNLDALDGAHHDLGDLGVGGEDLLGMGEDFDIMEFADALDNLEDLSGDEDGPGSKKSDGESDSAPASSVASPAAGPAPPPLDTSSNLPVQRPVQQPPPYTIVTSAPGQVVRGPPPPYPGQNFGPNVAPPPGPRVRANKTYDSSKRKMVRRNRIRN